MKVLVATVAHNPDDARIRHREIRALQDRGHQVTFLGPFRAFGVEPFPGIRCLDVSRSHGLRRLGPVASAGRIMWREGPSHDVVIGHDPELLPALMSLTWRAKRTVTVWDVHEDVPAQMHMMTWLPSVLKQPAAAVATAIERLAERRLHLTLAEHAYADRFHKSHPVVPNSVRVPARLPHGDEDQGLRVVYVGAITQARGLAEMLQVARELPHGVHLELIGNATPEIDARLRALPPEARVDYRGFVPNSEALRRLPGAIAGLSLLHDHDNYAHSQPTKLMEYMAYGVPVITTPNRSSRELVERCQSGFVVAFGDTAAVVDRVREILSRPVLRTQLSRAGHEAALAGFDWGIDSDRFVDQLEAWCNESCKH